MLAEPLAEQSCLSAPLGCGAGADLQTGWEQLHVVTADVTALSVSFSFVLKRSLALISEGVFCLVKHLSATRNQRSGVAFLQIQL